MKHVLVTGGNGQLGQELRRMRFSAGGIEFVFTDVDELDITREAETDRFLDGNKPDFIVNCAAYNAVDRAEDEPGPAFMINAEAVRHLAEAAASKGILLIHISTDFVFDGEKKEPYKSGDRPNPLSVYGKSKLAGEEYILQSGSGIIIRTSWLYSVFGANFVKTILRIANERDEIQVVDDQIGTPTWACDLAGMITRVIRVMDPGKSGEVTEILHYSNQGHCSWYDFAREIISLAGIDCTIRPVPSAQYPQKARRPSYSVLDHSGTAAKFNLDIPGWKQSLAACIGEIKKKPQIT